MSRLHAELAQDYRLSGHLDEADDLLPRISDAGRRAREELEIAFLRQDWPRTEAAAIAYLDTDHARGLKPIARSRIYQKLARAQASQGDLADAATSLERALYFDPQNERVQGWLRDMERGINPFAER